ncbi:MAG TPA: DNA cytosine methyltransferase [Verrucomicrobiota bacterium]|nr:DNA cytosine methyltransferase [Verrucomicrobiota bacterium]HRR65922.1 DNA cytosine methyltransferase [Candidatus Paceibacterota bacterium]
MSRRKTDEFPLHKGAPPWRFSSSTDPKLSVIDLFCGCGGFTLGMERAGLHTLAAIDSNPQAIAVHRHNFPHIAHVLEKDLTVFKPEHLDALIHNARVDLIIGGPPCQGFSPARRRDGANHGPRVITDARRELYQEFLGYVAYYQPKVFVMENVQGIKSAAGGEFFTRVQAEARALGYRVHGERVHAWRYGVPQKRIRQLIIGTRFDLPIFTTRRYMPPWFAASEDESEAVLPLPVTLWEAIGDLPPLAAGDMQEHRRYDFRRRRFHLARYTGRYLESVLQVHRARKLTAHCARFHSDRDLRDFQRLREGESSAVAMRERHLQFEWPYSKEHFKDRYTRQHRNRLCSTIVAHMSKDGLMFIHPTQVRSLTPREAARIQSFPDWFEFPVAFTHQFRLIGNAVPPLLGEAVGHAVRCYLADARRAAVHKAKLRPLPRDERQAVAWLLPLLEAVSNNTLGRLPDSEFKRGWFSIGFIHSRLHPDSAAENGKRQLAGQTEMPLVARLAPDAISPVFAQSGWPVKLVPVAKEALRRFDSGLLREEEFYCSDAQMAGARRLKNGGQA